MSTPQSLDALRAALDEVNQRLVDALHERARLCRAIGACKRAAGLPAVDAAREAAMLTALGATAPADGFAPAQLEAILRAVFAASRALVVAGTGSAGEPPGGYVPR